MRIFLDCVGVTPADQPTIGKLSMPVMEYQEGEMESCLTNGLSVLSVRYVTGTGMVCTSVSSRNFYKSTAGPRRNGLRLNPIREALTRSRTVNTLT